MGLYEPPHNISNNLHMPKTKAQISCAVTALLISVFVFATRVSPIPLLKSKFRASVVFSCDCTGQFVSKLVENNDCFFFHAKAHM